MRNGNVEITLNAQKWGVHVVDPHDPSLFLDGVSCRGCTWCRAQKIYLSDELDERTATKVIAHELTHAMIYATQIKDLGNPTTENFTEEDVCEFTALYGSQIADIAKDLMGKLF